MAIPSCYEKKDSFCYVCARYIIKNKRQPFKGQKLELYRMYFGFDPINLGSSFAPSHICSTCSTALYMFKKGRNFSFGKPACWKEVQNHQKDCFFCLTKTIGLNSLTKKTVNYPICKSVDLPVPHSEQCPRPIPYDEQIKNEQRKKDLLSIVAYQCNNLINEPVKKNLEINEKLNDQENEYEINKDKNFDLNNENLTFNSTTNLTKIIDQSDDLEMENQCDTIEIMNQSGDLVSESIIKELITNEPNSSFNLTIDSLLANSTQEIIESENELNKKETVNSKNSIDLESTDLSMDSTFS